MLAALLFSFLIMDLKCGPNWSKKWRNNRHGVLSGQGYALWNVSYAVTRVVSFFASSSVTGSTVTSNAQLNWLRVRAHHYVLCGGMWSTVSNTVFADHIRLLCSGSCEFGLVGFVAMFNGTYFEVDTLLFSVCGIYKPLETYFTQCLCFGWGFPNHIRCIYGYPSTYRVSWSQSLHTDPCGSWIWTTVFCLMAKPGPISLFFLSVSFRLWPSLTISLLRRPWRGWLASELGTALSSTGIVLNLTDLYVTY